MLEFNLLALRSGKRVLLNTEVKFVISEAASIFSTKELPTTEKDPLWLI